MFLDCLCIRWINYIGLQERVIRAEAALGRNEVCTKEAHYFYGWSTRDYATSRACWKALPGRRQHRPPRERINYWDGRIFGWNVLCLPWSATEILCPMQVIVPSKGALFYILNHSDIARQTIGISHCGTRANSGQAASRNSVPFNVLRWTAERRHALGKSGASSECNWSGNNWIAPHLQEDNARPGRSQRGDAPGSPYGAGGGKACPTGCQCGRLALGAAQSTSSPKPPPFGPSLLAPPSRGLLTSPESLKMTIQTIHRFIVSLMAQFAQIVH